jgi:hypothetical protein
MTRKEASMIGEKAKTNPLAVISLATGLIPALIFLAFMVLSLIGPSIGSGLSSDAKDGIVRIAGSLSCVMVLLPPIALVFGIMARNQIKAKGRTEKGERLALFGIAFGSLFTVGAICIVMQAVSLLVR